MRKLVNYEINMLMSWRVSELSFLCTHVRYLKGALVPDSGSAQDALEAPTGRRRDYIPTGSPGSRLPHMNVRLLLNLTSEVCPSLISPLSLPLFFWLYILFCFTR